MGTALVASDKQIKRRVLLVDDHPIVREGLIRLLNREDDLTVCGEASSAVEALAALGNLKPDLVVLDISLPDINGIELIKNIHSRQPNTPMVVFSVLDGSLYAERALRAGCHGYVMKHQSPENLVEAIRQVLAGKIWVNNQVRERISDKFDGQFADRSPLDRLSNRELEVLECLGRGRTTRQIAEQLRLSTKTIDVFRANLKAKLKLKNSAELVHFAIKWLQDHGLD